MTENSKLNTELNRTSTRIQELEKSLESNQSEIESIVVVVRGMESENQILIDQNKSLEKKLHKTDRENRKIAQTLLLPHAESQSVIAHKQQIEDLKYSISQIEFAKSTLEESILQQRDQFQSLESLLQQTLNIKDVHTLKPQIERSNECIICQENERVIAFVPCGHKSVCEKCSLFLTICPICRSHFDAKYRIYH